MREDDDITVKNGKFTIGKLIVETGGKSIPLYI
jgi:hypothetical protein